MNVRTVPLILFLQIGQSFNAGAHFAQEIKCPHGNNTIETSSSIQIWKDQEEIWSKLYYVVFSQRHKIPYIPVCNMVTITLQSICSFSLSFSSSRDTASIWFVNTSGEIKDSDFLFITVSSNEGEGRGDFFLFWTCFFCFLVLLLKNNVTIKFYLFGNCNSKLKFQIRTVY